MMITDIEINNGQPHKKYTGKLFLFGEYTILHSQKGLAIPISRYYGKWDITPLKNESNSVLLKLLDYLMNTFSLKEFDYKEFKLSLENGLYFHSNIPQGYGLGSSAAVSAAVYDRFFYRKTDDLIKTKEVLSMIESYFHGKSSGIDPLVSYIDNGIYMKNGIIEKVKKNKLNAHIFLLDTLKRRDTKTLVDFYIKEREQNKLFRAKMELLATLNQKAITLYKEEKNKFLFDVIKQISVIQYEQLQHMIPENFKFLWKKSLQSSDYSFKLNGAGGGGFLMIYKYQNININLDFPLISIGV